MADLKQYNMPPLRAGWTDGSIGPSLVPPSQWSQAPLPPANPAPLPNWSNSPAPLQNPIVNDALWANPTNQNPDLDEQTYNRSLQDVNKLMEQYRPPDETDMTARGTRWKAPSDGVFEIGRDGEPRISNPTAYAERYGIPLPTGGDVLAALPKYMAWNAAQGIGAAGDYLFDATPGIAGGPPVEGPSTVMDKVFKRLEEYSGEQVQKALPDNFEYLEGPMKYGTLGMGSVGFMAPSLLAGGGAGRLSGSVKAATNFTVSMMGVSAAGIAETEFEKKGYGPLASKMLGGGVGLVEGFTELTPMGTMMSKFGPSWPAGMAKFFIEQTGQEIAAETLTAGIEAAFHGSDPAMTWDNYWDRMGEMMKTLPFALPGMAIAGKGMQVAMQPGQVIDQYQRNKLEKAGKESTPEQASKAIGYEMMQQMKGMNIAEPDVAEIGKNMNMTPWQVDPVLGGSRGEQAGPPVPPGVRAGYVDGLAGLAQDTGKQADFTMHAKSPMHSEAFDAMEGLLPILPLIDKFSSADPVMANVASIKATGKPLDVSDDVLAAMGQTEKDMSRPINMPPVLEIADEIWRVRKPKNPGDGWTVYAHPGPNMGGNRYEDAVDVATLPTEFAARTYMNLIDARAADVGGLDMTVYHGSPHKFDQFSIDKMGTGEGAQAYGYGTYLAEREVVATSYRKLGQLHYNEKGLEGSLGLRINSQGEDAARKWLDSNYGDFYSAEEKDALIERSKPLAEKAKGNLYEADLTDTTIDKMLDWDAPLSEQPESVRKALEQVSLGKKPVKDMSRDELIDVLQNIDSNGVWTDADSIAEFGRPATLKELRDSAENMGIQEYLSSKLSGSDTGQSIYKQLTASLGGGNTWSNDAQRQASEQLQKLGIPGIKYYDGSSRAAGKGTRNFVVFDPKDVPILSRNGVPIVKPVPSVDIKPVGDLIQVAEDMGSDGYELTTIAPENEMNLAEPLAYFVPLVLQKIIDVQTPDADQLAIINSSLNRLVQQGNFPVELLNGITLVVSNDVYHDGREAGFMTLWPTISTIGIRNDLMHAMQVAQFENTPFVQQSFDMALAHELTHFIDYGRNGNLSASHGLSAMNLGIDQMYVQGNIVMELNRNTVGKVMYEAVQSYLNDPELGRHLSYPLGKLKEAVRNQNTTLQKEIQYETLAQLGALYYTMPELLRQRMPQAYLMMGAIHGRVKDAITGQLGGRLPSEVQGGYKHRGVAWILSGNNQEAGDGPGNWNTGPPSGRDELGRANDLTALNMAQHGEGRRVVVKKFKREKASGRYVGAPDWVGASTPQLRVMASKLKRLAIEGEYGRYWYENSSRAILDLVGGDKAEAEKFVGLIAIYSPNNTVPGNTTAALKAYYQWKNGQKIDAGFSDADRKAQKLMDRGEYWEGIKTNSFYQNLMVEIDPSKLDPGVATMDMWMAIAGDYGKKSLDQGPQYEFMERMINNVSARLGWDAHQTQATIWTAMKGRVDPISALLLEKDLKAGNVIFEIKETPKGPKKTKKYLNAKAHFKLAHKLGMARKVDPIDITEAAYDFSNAINDRVGQMSWEATPGVTSGVLPGIHNATMAQHIEYLEAIKAALTNKSGHDIIAKTVGAAVAKSIRGFSGWEGVGTVGIQDGIAMPSASGVVKEYGKDIVNLVADIRGLVLSQEGVAWHYPIYNGGKYGQNGHEVDIGRLLSQQENSELYLSIIKELGHSWSPPIPRVDGQGFRVLNFPDEKFELAAEKAKKTPDKAKIKELQKTLRRLNGEFHHAVARAIHSQPWYAEVVDNSPDFESDGELRVNNWENGDADYRGRIAEAGNKISVPAENRWAGRSDILEWVDNDLTPLVQSVQKEFEDRYGWDQAGQEDLLELNQNAGPRKRVNPRTDNIRQAIIRLGGIAQEEADLHHIDYQEQIVGVGTLVRRMPGDGRTLDDLAMVLDEYGYPVQNEAGNYDPNILAEIVRTGDDALTPAGEEHKMEVGYAEREADQDYLQALSQDTGPIPLAGTDLEPFLARLNSEQAAKDLLVQVIKQNEDTMRDARRGTMTVSEMQQRAADLGWTEADMKALKRGAGVNPEEFEAGRVITDAALTRLKDLADVARNGSDQDKMNFNAALNQFKPLAETMLGMRAEWGRVGVMMQQQASQNRQIKEVMDALGGTELIAGKAAVIADLTDRGSSDSEIARVANQLAKTRRIDQLMEAWYASLLSGLRTHAVNSTSNALVALWTLPETLTAAMLGKVFNREDRVYFREITARAVGMMNGIRDGAMLAEEIIREDMPMGQFIANNLEKVLGVSDFIKEQADTLMTNLGQKVEGQPRAKHIPGKMGAIIRAPLTMLSVEDAIFQMTGQRMELYAQATRQAIMEKAASVSTRAEWIVGAVDGLLGQDRPNVKDMTEDEKMLWNIFDRAWEQGKYQTFTNELGNFGMGANRLINQNLSGPGAMIAIPARVIMPFVKTPTNIVKFFGHRTPLAFTMPSFWEMYNRGGAYRNIALARVLMGSAVMTLFLTLSLGGRITGGGPSDDERNERRLWRQKYSPYSIKIGDKYYAYNRLEPLGMLMGVAADMGYLWDEMDMKSQGELLVLVHASILRNLMSKTWLTGLNEAINVFYEPSRYGERYMGRLAATAIPTMVGHIASYNDPYMRQTNSIMDAFRNKIPGMRKDLLIRYNMWGQPITYGGILGPDLVSFIYMGQDPGDKVVDELIKIKHYPGMPGKKVNDVELTPEQYNLLVRLRGIPAKAWLDKIVGTPYWDTMSEWRKVKEVDDTFRESTKAARVELARRYPDIPSDDDKKDSREMDRMYQDIEAMRK